MQDVDKKGDAFRFGKGIVHSIRDRHWDIMLDLPQGMGSNNSKLSRRFRKGGIAKVGMRPLSLLKNPKTASYQPALKPNEIIPGHSYYVRLADGKRYGKIRIIRFSQALKTVEFRWQLF